ncbi:MAG: glycosyltransferase family 9 protein [Dokdonella sp.]
MSISSHAQPPHPYERRTQWRRGMARRLMRILFGNSAVPAPCGTLPTHGIQRILVCHISHTLGNTLLLTPLIGELQRLYPGAEIDIVTRSPVGLEIFGQFANVRRVLRLPRHALTSPLVLWRALSAMRAQTYDIAIDPDLRSQSDRLCVLAAHARYKLGYAGARKSGTLSHPVPSPQGVTHVGQFPVDLLRAATGARDSAPYPHLDISLSLDERSRGADLLARVIGGSAVFAEPIIGLFCNATANKNLGSDWWRRFAVRLRERCSNERIVEIVPATGVAVLEGDWPAFYSSDLRRLGGALSALALYISADCGVMHLACAAGTPVTGLFAVTDPAQWGPYGPHDHVIDIHAISPEQAANQVSMPGLPNSSEENR